jgi:putative integral membrane protein (TIGR02587 family)
VRERAAASSDIGRGLARAFAGAVLFAVPLFMTMEMWQLGHSMRAFPLALLVGLTLPLLVGLSYFTGFEHTQTLLQDIRDAFIAFGVGFVASAVMLGVLGLLDRDLHLVGFFGIVGLQAVPASIGAIVANKQLHGSDDDDEDDDDGPGEDEHERRAGYPAQLFLMLAGAVFMAFNLAPTEEMALIAFTMSPWHGVALMLVSIALLHVLVYSVGFAGQHDHPEWAGFGLTFLHFTLAGYGIGRRGARYMLWTFERTAGLGPGELASMVVVLGFPASLGAATARLVV